MVRALAYRRAMRLSARANAGPDRLRVRGDWATPLHEFRSRDRVRVVAEIERLLVEYGRE
jgi:hypothetical protein